MIDALYLISCSLDWKTIDICAVIRMSHRKKEKQMSLNSTPSGERVHIGFFGVRNAGKSSLVNAVTNQRIAVVSDVKGTTTDPVKKAMELLPLGPVVIIDTPGLDDEGELGMQRVMRAKEILSSVDIAVLVTDVTRGLCAAESELIAEFKKRRLPYVVANNKSDLVRDTKQGTQNSVFVSAKTGEGIEELKNAIGALGGSLKREKRIVSDLVSKGDTIILVIPIDESAPKGRIILPQQLVLRDALDNGCIAAACQPEELSAALSALKSPPALVITDSQAFGRVAKDVPRDVPLTSFSILMARYKGELESLLEGAKSLETLGDGDRVLISEGCTHHRQCGDIGTVKLPAWIEKCCGTKPEFEFSSGTGFPKELGAYKLIIHCGACMLNETEMRRRQAEAAAAGVPMVNYGMAIAQMNGILERSMEIIKKKDSSQNPV